MNPQTTPITVNVPVDVNEALKEASSRQLISKSALIRIIITNHVRSRQKKIQPGA